MLYRINNTQTQVAKSSGKSYWTADLTDDNGQNYERVATFLPVFKDGQSVDGFLESELYNGKTSYKFKTTQTVTSPKAVAQDRIEASISRTLDRKEDSYAISGSIRDAVIIVNQIVGSKIAQGESPDEVNIKKMIREWATWFMTLHENPNEIRPSSSGLD